MNCLKYKGKIIEEDNFVILCRAFAYKRDKDGYPNSWACAIIIFRSTLTKRTCIRVTHPAIVQYSNKTYPTFGLAMKDWNFLNRIVLTEKIEFYSDWSYYNPEEIYPY
jgi:hypothetical protein